MSNAPDGDENVSSVGLNKYNRKSYSAHLNSVIGDIFGFICEIGWSYFKFIVFIAFTVVYKILLPVLCIAGLASFAWEAGNFWRAISAVLFIFAFLIIGMGGLDFVKNYLWPDVQTLFLETKIIFAKYSARLISFLPKPKSEKPTRTIETPVDEPQPIQNSRIHINARKDLYLGSLTSRISAIILYIFSAVFLFFWTLKPPTAASNFFIDSGVLVIKSLLRLIPSIADFGTFFIKVWNYVWDSVLSIWTIFSSGCFSSSKNDEVSVALCYIRYNVLPISIGVTALIFLSFLMFRVARGKSKKTLREFSIFKTAPSEPKKAPAEQRSGY